MINKLSGQNVFLTGAGGFIGSTIATSLIEKGAHVKGLVGAPGQEVRELPKEAMSCAADITDMNAIMKFVANNDVVIHLAGPPSVRDSFEAAMEYARVHVLGTATVLDACRKQSVRRFIYISSAEVYGQPLVNPVTEDHRLQARSPYAAAKIGAEKFIEAFASSFGIKAIIFRPFSIYGPGLFPNSVIGTILRQAKQKDAITLATLRPMRDYCYVNDLAEAVVQACTKRIPDLSYINIGSGKGTSVAELANVILGILGRVHMPVREELGKKRPGNSEIYKLIADVSMARDLLGWEPSVTLRSGLIQTIRSMEVI